MKAQVIELRPSKSGNGFRAREKLGVKQIDRWRKSPDRRPGHKLADGGGLYLTFLPSGRASWQIRYAQGGKVRTYSIGSADEVSLAEARAARARVRAQASTGLDPVIERHAKRAESARRRKTPSDKSLSIG